MYEKVAIEKWFEHSDKSPMTKNLVPVVSIKNIINDLVPRERRDLDYKELILQFPSLNDDKVFDEYGLYHKGRSKFTFEGGNLHMMKF